MCLDRIISAFCIHVWTFTRFSPFFFFLCDVIINLIQCEQCTPQQLFQHLLINFSATFQQLFSHRTHKLYFSTTFSLKMRPLVLFTHLKIILLQCFQFLVFNFSKISSIQTDPQCQWCSWFQKHNYCDHKFRRSASLFQVFNVTLLYLNS